ncbi:unnamed protein product [Prorocentrum cordatum]|uniref:Uncharacterized protein n=1 Tax=Prorocentrum cordatum TaxID=2364126 RepID=A0ABN9RE86_9DINO|nr:unnamed protein product [Polarella glacialis]
MARPLAVVDGGTGSDSSSGPECSSVNGSGNAVRTCIGSCKVYLVLLILAALLALSIVFLPRSGQAEHIAIAKWWMERKVKKDYSGRWCAGIAEHPLWGTEEVTGLCPPARDILFETNVSAPVLDENLTARQLKNVRDYLDEPNNLSGQEYELYDEALGVLEKISTLQPKDVLAFRETWTNADTDILRALDSNPRVWLPQGGKLTTTAFASQLPSVADFRRLVESGPAAIVGGADSLVNMSLGHEIDAHPVVVRFNAIIGDKLSAPETGVKMNLHVMCAKVPPATDSSVWEMDLEASTPWRTYCGRMHKGGEFENVTVRSKLFMFRPSAFCRKETRFDFQGWTRGFLFYWFVGRLFDSLTMYGFKGGGHYKNDEVMHERYWTFEHFFYDINEPDRY